MLYKNNIWKNIIKKIFKKTQKTNYLKKFKYKLKNLKIQI